MDAKYFYDTYHWLIFSDSNSTIRFFRNASLNINADINLVVISENFTVYDVYNPAFSHGGKLIVHQEVHNDFRPKSSNKYWLRRNMTGVHFKSAIVVPQMTGKLEDYLNNEDNKQINSMHRFQAVTVQHCRDLYNFTLTVQRTDSWGYKEGTGRFDGLVGLLERKEVDFGSSPLIYKLDRMPVIDYSYGNWILRSTFIFRKPKLSLSSYEIFLRPLNTYVWIGIGVFLALIALLLKLMFTREVRIGKAKHHEVDASWSFLFVYTVGAICQQATECKPQFMSSRTVTIFLFLFCILIYDFYSASIVSYLLMDSPIVLKNLRDLTDSKLLGGIEDILIDRNYFVQTTDPVAIELFIKKIKGSSNNSGFYEPEYGIDRVRRGGFAFHVETSTAYPIIERTFTNDEICDLQEVQMYRTQPMHTNLQKNSPFREMMNFCMYKMVENGLMYRLRQYWDARKPTCLEQVQVKTIHMNLIEFSWCLILLGYGICFSLIFLVLEIFHYKINNKVVQPFIN